MPNWASNECTIVGDERDLKSLYETIKGLENISESRVDYVFWRLHLGRVRVNSALLSVCTPVENGFGKEWLGNLVDALGGDWQKVYCRGYWTDVQYSEGQLNLFIESAWSPPTEVFDFIQQKFPSLKILYYCEEPGCGVYVTNDKESMFYSARYIAYVCIDEDENEEEYFDEKEDALEWISAQVGKEITNDEELKSFEDELQEKNIDNYCYIEEIQVI